MTEEITGPYSVYRDERTIVVGVPQQAAAEQPLGPREAFVVAYDRMLALAEIAREPSIVVAAVTPHYRLVDAVLVGGGKTLIVGRHSRCGLRLHAPEIALRQVAVLVARQGDATITRLWDLNSGAPFRTEDGQPNAAVLADGPFYITVHGYALWLVPSSTAVSWSGRAIDAWKSLPERVLVDRRPADKQRPLRAAVPRPRPVPECDVDAITRVTLVGPPLVLGDPEGIEIGWGTLRLEDSTQRLQHEVSAERLEQGILIGRYDRCGLEIHDAMSRISRVHALLVKLGGDVWIIDTASTNGTRRGDAAVEAELLGDIDTLVLANATTLRWRRRRHAEA